MVKPRINTNVYDNQHVEPELMKRKLKKMNLGGIPIRMYEYPCKDTRNCNTCFNNFALTMKPNGDMIICNEALSKIKIDETRFNGIDIEKVNYKNEYGI